MESRKNKITICRTTLKVLNYSLLWPSEKNEMDPGKWYYIGVITFFVMTGLWILSVAMHIFVTTRNNIDVPLTEDIAFLCSFLGLYYLSATFVKKRPKLALLLRDLSDFEEFGKPPGFEKENKRLTFWSRVCFYYTFGGINCYTITKLLEIPSCEKNNKDKGIHENCGFATGTWFPFEINYFPVYSLVFVYIFVTNHTFARLSMTISYVPLEISSHIVLRINHLKLMIERCFEDEDAEISERNLKKCLLYHLKILGFSSRLDDCFSSIMFTHLTITGVICGCLEKQFVETDNKIGSLMHMLAWVAALFIACLGGQKLINASDTIIDAIFSSKWYQSDVKLRKNLAFMLLRSQRGLRLTVGSFGILSFELFVSVMKLSYSILAMLTS